MEEEERLRLMKFSNFLIESYIFFLFFRGKNGLGLNEIK